MVLPKSTVHVSRLAGTALKSFTHGYAQTVVAASQSSYASQNTPVAPLAGNLLSRFKEKRAKQIGQHGLFSTSAASQHVAEPAAANKDVDGSLGHFHELWQKHHKAEAKDPQSFQLARRIGWKPPTTIPEPQSDLVPEHVVETAVALPSQDGGVLVRSYSMSAVDNFAKAIDDKELEDLAIDRVNESINIEAARNKRLAVEEAVRQETSLVAENELASLSSQEAALLQAFENQQYAVIPALFEAMLREGVHRPSQHAYRALMAAALHLTHNKHQTVPRLLDIYADMMHRSIAPDVQTLAIIIDALATRALDAAETSRAISRKQSRIGNPSVFALDRLELGIMSEDKSLDIALKFISTAPADFTLDSRTSEVLIEACALQGFHSEMISIYNALPKADISRTTIFPVMITSFGKIGDLNNAVASYDDYRNLAIANNAGENVISRIDQDVYAALIQAYGHSGQLEKGKKLLARVEVDEKLTNARTQSREAILVNGLLPLELQARNLEGVYAIMNSLSPVFYIEGLAKVAITMADGNQLAESVKAFDALVRVNANSPEAVAAIYAAHLRIEDLAAGERFFKMLEQSPISLEIMQLSVLRGLAYIAIGQASSGLRSAGSMLVKYRDHFQPKSAGRQMALERIEESIDILCKKLFNGAAAPLSTAAAADMLRIINETGLLIAQHAEAILSAVNAEQISYMVPADLEIYIQTQARLILDDRSTDVAAAARFAYMLETLIGRSVLPNVATENVIEKALINLGRADLSQMWNSYRYPEAPSMTSPVASTPLATSNSAYSPHSTSTPASVYEDSFDPYLGSTDHRGSVAITDVLEKSHGRPDNVLREAMTKFRNIRRVGRHPRFFAYAKLIQAAAQAHQLGTAQEILGMAQQDVPLVAKYKIVRHGWVSILDSMVAACITTGRRDLASEYHQDLLNMGAAPSANTFGLYITSLKETTKTFDEASEAVKIFLRAKAEGVEPTSFLYNALIGKLGKARRIDDCLYYFAEMRNLGIRPTSVTYGTIVNALCRVSDEKFAEEIFEEMESSVNYKPRPAPYHSLMQFFLTTKRDRSKVLAYHERMVKQRIEPTMHTYKLLIDAHATLEPIDMGAAEAVLQTMGQAGVHPEAVHYASLIHAKGCVTHDLEGARVLFNDVLNGSRTQIQPCVYQAMFESLVANRQVAQSEALLSDMKKRHVELTPYIVNALIHGWTQEKDLGNAKRAFGMINKYQREPSTYEAMVKAHLAVEDRAGAEAVVKEALSRGYPNAVAGKIADLVAGGRA